MTAPHQPFVSDSLCDTFRHPIIRAIDSLAGPGCMDDVFRELAAEREEEQRHAELTAEWNTPARTEGDAG